jgi:hypothetical protein
LCCNRGWLESKKVKVGAIVAVSVGLVAMLAVVASIAHWFSTKYRHRDQVKYNKLKSGRDN